MAEELEVTVADHPLVCHHCGGKRFYERTVTMHGAAGDFLGLDWFSARGAFCYTCSNCGYVHWFLPKV
jgi:hypothetical protein